MTPGVARAPALASGLPFLWAWGKALWGPAPALALSQLLLASPSFSQVSQCHRPSHSSAQPSACSQPPSPHHTCP